VPDIWELASTLVKFLLCLGVLGSTGLVLVRIVFARETRSLHATMVRQATAFAVLALLAAGAGFALNGAAMTGALSGMADPEMLGLLWQTPAGTAFAYRIAGLGLVLLGLRLAGIGLPIAAAGGLAVLWSFSRVGHVTDVGALWLEIVLLLHLVGAAFWIGVLLPLRALAGDRENLSLAAGLGHRFGRIAAVTVPLLIAAGIVMAWRLLGGLEALLETGYGLTLLAKIGAVACLLAAAAANKLRFVPGMRAGDRRAAVALRRSIAVEGAAIFVVLLATAALTTLQGAPWESSP